MSLDNFLELLCGSLSLHDSTAAINTLKKIVQNALDHPGDEHYRQISITNKAFSTKVWKHHSAQEFLVSIGWVEVDGMVVLPSDDLLPDAMVALTKAQSLLEAQGAPVSGQQTSAHTASVHSDREAYRERMRELREQMKHVELEKKRIVEQIRADRRETDQRRAHASHSTPAEFGPHRTTFKDIGVDLNRGGG